MPMLYAICPVSGGLIETGVQSDDESLTIMANSKMAVFCDRCGQHHMMQVRELYDSPEEAEEAA